MRKIINTNERVRLLIIEDNYNYLVTLTFWIEKLSNIDYTICTGATQALRANIGMSNQSEFLYEKFDYILVDFLTDLHTSGLDLIQLMPKHLRKKCIPFSGSELDNQDMIEAGASNKLHGKSNLKEILKGISERM